MNKRTRLGILAGAVTVGLALASPAYAQEDPAFEHGEPAVTATPADECGQVELTFTNPTPWLFVFDVRVDGEDALHGSVAPGVEVAEGPLAGQEFGPRWQLIEVDGRDDVHEVVETFTFDTLVEARLAEGGEQKLYFDWREIDVSDVEPCPVPSADVKWTDQCAEPDVKVSITNTSNEEYTFRLVREGDGEVGRWDLDPGAGNYTGVYHNPALTVEVKSGDEWTEIAGPHNWSDPGDCSSPSPSPSASADPGGEGGELPKTSGQTSFLPLLLTGGGLLLLGFGAVAASRLIPALRRR